MSVEHILDRIRKLLRLAGNNPNPEEAASAAAMAQRMLDAHNLSAAMLDLDEPDPRRTPKEPIQDYGLGAPLDVTGRDRARIALASIIARANGCRIYFWGRRVCLIGRSTDAEAVRYLFAWVNGEMQRLAEVYGQGRGIVWRNNFKLGIVDTIERKLLEGHKAMAAEAKAHAAHNTHALMVVSQALAQLEQKNTAVDLWVEANMTFSRPRRQQDGQYDGHAREAGQRVGESIGLRSRRSLPESQP